MLLYTGLKPPEKPEPTKEQASPPPTGRDRGPAAFFRGRKDIRARFSTVLSESISLNAGTTFLIQGPPGVGKSALLAKLCEENPEWNVVHIGTQDLWSPVAMSQSMNESYDLDRQVAASIGIEFFKLGGVKRVAGDASPEQVLKRLSPRHGLILVLDEAQKLRGLLSQNREQAISTLDEIHNGKLGKPVVLLTAGLGISENIYKTLDVSRFGRGCVNYLGRLGREQERAVINDWLTKGGGAIGDTSGWIDAIALCSHGWPQHIISYAVHAKEYLEFHQGHMTDEGLQSVLQQGDEERETYYTARLKDITLRQRQVLARLFVNVPKKSPIEKEYLIDALTEKYSHVVATDMFDDLLHRGVIAETEEGGYNIPIPSFYTWFTANYGVYKGMGGGKFSWE